MTSNLINEYVSLCGAILSEINVSGEQILALSEKWRKWSAFDG
ncbi:hypothetical protein MAQ5080_01064 [Marinomonas aquimarina]|uniref:Uncharacterized protein n=1 Tax=Marinomonas aquimarina TaxID=295068 RepID=A0A1A8T7N3_9GAMM|nr:hypothetical protein MAQ5080_01064 [Marinomonas aquimarina]